MTLLEKVCTPVTTEAAKSEPGRCGTDGVEPRPAVEVPGNDVDTVGVVAVRP